MPIEVVFTVMRARFDQSASRDTSESRGSRAILDIEGKGYVCPFAIPGQRLGASASIVSLFKPSCPASCEN
jgi:hypothetical protein